MITKAGGAKIRFHLPCNFDDVVVSLCKFYNEYGPRITLNKKTIFVLLNIIFCTLKNVMIDQFTRTRLILQRNNVCTQCFIYGIEMDAKQTRFRGR